MPAAPSRYENKSKAKAYYWTYLFLCILTSLLVEFRVNSGFCPLVRLTGDFEDVEVEHLGMARTWGDKFLEEFEVRGRGAAEFRDKLVVADGISEVQVKQEAHDRLVCQGVMAIQCVRTLLAQHGWMPFKVVAARGLETVRVLVEDRDEARDLTEFVRTNYSSFELTRVTLRGAVSMTAAKDLSAFGLTKRQAEVLERALFGGYFDSQRKKTAKEVARALGIDRSTFARHLRAALKKILSDLLG